jgi:hypothetical protein
MFQVCVFREIAHHGWNRHFCYQDDWTDRFLLACVRSISRYVEMLSSQKNKQKIILVSPSPKYH